eukprot:g6324.t1
MAGISSRQIRAGGEWNDCPEIVGEALGWMGTAAVGLLDIASVGPLTPVCEAFTALIEAAQGATEAAENLGELVSWCAFLVSVFIKHFKHVADLRHVAKTLDEFVSTTIELAKRAKDQLLALCDGMARDANVASTALKRFNSMEDVIQYLTTVISVDARLRMVVLDDVWEREVLDTLKSTGLQLLVTTRLSSVVAVEGGRTRVGNMDRAEARKLLKKSGAVVLSDNEADQVADACGWHALTLAIAGSLRSVGASPNSVRAWQTVHSEIVKKKMTALGPRMNADVGDDPTKLSLFPVLDLSLESLGEDELRLFLTLVVPARVLLAPARMLVSIWQQDHRGARKEAEVFASNSLLQEVGDSFRLHDLLLDFIAIKCQGEDALVEEAVKRQSQYLGRLAVLRGYANNGKFLKGLYSLIGLWRKLNDLGGNGRLEVATYSASLGELRGDESEDAAHVFWAVGRLLGLQES